MREGLPHLSFTQRRFEFQGAIAPLHRQRDRLARIVCGDELLERRLGMLGEYSARPPPVAAMSTPRPLALRRALSKT